MALTKVNRGGLNTGISDSSNATFLTVDTSEQAVIKSEGGAVTTSVQQGLAKSFILQENLGSFTTHDSLNVSSTNDYATGTIQPIFTNPFNNDDYIATGGFASGIYNGSCMVPHASGNDDAYNHSTTDFYCYIRGNTNASADDCERIPITIHGDLA